MTATVTTIRPLAPANRWHVTRDGDIERTPTGKPCPPDACDYREVTPHGLKSAAFVECRTCGHTGWLIVP
jgi:hypothetical protein